MQLSGPEKPAVKMMEEDPRMSMEGSTPSGRSFASPRASTSQGDGTVPVPTTDNRLALVVPDPVTTNSTAAPSAAADAAAADRKAASLNARSAACCLNRLQLMKAAYLAYFSALPVMTVFAPLVYGSKGFSAHQIGWLLAVPAVGTIVVAPPVSTFAETRHRQVTVVVAAMIATSALVAVILLTNVQAVIVASALLYGLVSRTISPMLDEYTMAVIGPERKSQWGSFRVFGAYGWASSAVLTSLVGGHLGWGYCLIIYVAGAAGLLLCIFQAPVDRGLPGNHHYLDVLKRFVKRRDVVTFWCGATLMGTGMALVGGYLFLFLESLNADPILYGLCMVFTVSVEVPIFRNSDKLYARLTDHQLILIAMGAWVFRAVCYSLLQNPWHVLFIEPIHGVTFGFNWLAGMRYFPENFPKEFSNSAISLLHAGVYGVAPIVGNVAGGYAYSGLGPRHMFLYAAIMMAVGAVAFYAASKAAAAATRRPSESDEVAANATPAAAAAIAVIGTADGSDNNADVGATTDVEGANKRA